MLATIDELEFWWLSPEQRERFLYAYPAYQDQLPNHQLPGLIYEKRVAIGELEEWSYGHRMINVHRKLSLYESQVGDCQTLAGPVLLDFDNEGENLEPACKCVSEALGFLQHDLGIDLSVDCRVYFSGRKGFHIELRPSAVPTNLLQRIGHFKRTHLDMKLISHMQGTFHTSAQSVNQLDNEGTVLDKVLSAKRINGSINAWGVHGDVYYRKMIPVAIDALLTQDPHPVVVALIQRSNTTTSDS